jgi:hypothetical protein
VGYAAWQLQGKIATGLVGKLFGIHHGWDPVHFVIYEAIVPERSTLQGDSKEIYRW